MYLEGLWLYAKEKETSSAVGQNFSMTHGTSVNLGRKEVREVGFPGLCTQGLL